jgi:type IV pilus assembly protein PilM
MALEIVKRKALPIGMDLGSSRAKLVQLRVAANEVELLAAGAVDIPFDGEKSMEERLEVYSAAIRAIIRSKPFKTRQCVLSLPAQDTFVQHIRVPRLPPEETKGALRTELQSKLPYPVDDAVIREIIAGDVHSDGDPRREVIIIAASRATVEAYVGMARQAKLDVVGVNVEACAIVECFARLFRRATDAARTILYADLGASTTQVVLSHGNHIVFARNLSIGGRELDRAVADGLSVPIEQAKTMRHNLQEIADQQKAQDELYHLLDGPLDALGDELRQCLHYYESVFRNQAIERAIFIGGQAHDKRLCQALAQRLNLPTQVGDPLLRIKRPHGVGMEVGPDQRGPQPDWAVAVGLCLGAEKAA